MDISQAYAENKAAPNTNTILFIWSAWLSILGPVASQLITPMIHVSAETFHYILMPMIAAQMLLTVLLYFSLVSRHAIKGLSYFATCLLCYAAYLFGRALQSNPIGADGAHLLYARVALLYSLGIPSMLVATSLQLRIKQGFYIKILPYACGVLATLTYIILIDGTSFHVLGTNRLLNTLAVPASTALAETIMFSYVTAIILLPCTYFIYQRGLALLDDPASMAFLLGTFSFAFFQVSSGFIENGYWWAYLGAIVTALCWAWAVFYDIRQTKGKAELLKAELQFLVRSGEVSSKAEIGHLLTQLEVSSQGNLELYKLKVREVLSRFIDGMIESGADADTLLARNQSKVDSIQRSNSSEAVKEIACVEAVELASMIVDLPQHQMNSVVIRCQAYIDEHFHSDIDVNSIATQVNVSQSYLMRTVKNATGKTINQLLTQRRIEQAKVLLQKHSVTETAFAVGFNSSNYFSTVFKKETGLTPGQYQQKSKG